MRFVQGLGLIGNCLSCRQPRVLQGGLCEQCTPSIPADGTVAKVATGAGGATILLVGAIIGTLLPCLAIWWFWTADSRRAEAANERGRDCLRRERLQCAVIEFSSATQQKPAVTKYRYNLALALASDGSYQQAAAELEAVLRADPADLNSRRLLASIQDALATRQAGQVADELRH